MVVSPSTLHTEPKENPSPVAGEKNTVWNLIRILSNGIDSTFYYITGFRLYNSTFTIVLFFPSLYGTMRKKCAFFFTLYDNGKQCRFFSLDLKSSFFHSMLLWEEINVFLVLGAYFE